MFNFLNWSLELKKYLIDDIHVILFSPTGPDGVYEPEFSQYENDFSLYTSQMSQQQTGLMGGQARRKILAILDAIEFAQVCKKKISKKYIDTIRKYTGKRI